MNAGNAQPRFPNVYVARVRGEGEQGAGCPAEESRECLARNRIEWLGGYPGEDRRLVIWHFRAPDAESVRIALRHAGISFEAVWVERALSD